MNPVFGGVHLVGTWMLHAMYRLQGEEGLCVAMCDSRFVGGT